MSVEASEMVSIPRAELDALKAELTQLRHEVGRGVAWGRHHDDAGPGDDRVILEAFKPGTAPPDNYSVVGAETANGGPLPAVSPDADRAVRSTGTGGLY